MISRVCTHARIQKVFFGWGTNIDYVFLVDEGREDPNKRVIIDPPAKRI